MASKAIIIGVMLLCAACSVLASTQPAPGQNILVLGSVNMDITVEVSRLPRKGETTSSPSTGVSLAVGGKGANQAAAARLSTPTSFTSRRVAFVCRFGNDSYADMLQQQLVASGVDVSGCVSVPDVGSGHGFVMLEDDGAASSIVVGGANTAWQQGEVLAPALLSDVGVLLLQREVPEAVNLAAAQAAAAAGVPVLLDAGGSDSPLPADLLPLISYLAPNELELQALTGMPTDTHDQVVAAARSLMQSGGVKSVLVTLSERGAVLVQGGASGGSGAGSGGGDTTVLSQPALSVPGGVVVDGTAAGDAFRAGFAVGLVQGWPLQHAMQFAAAAGALAVSRKGALPSLPAFGEVLTHLRAHTNSVVAPELLDTLADIASQSASQTCSLSDISCSGSAQAASLPTQPATAQPATPTAVSLCPLKFASRLNSMQARRDLVVTNEGGGDREGLMARNDVLGWIARQSQVQGLSLVDLNWPQHFEGLKLSQVQSALKDASLGVGAINIRFPATFLQGAFTNPDPALRQAAVQLAAEGCKAATDLGASQIVVWSPYDGYDHYMQVDYDAAWQHTVECYKQLSAACGPNTRVSLEFKPTDPSTRFSIVTNTASALLLAAEVNRPNFGLTLDIGHMLAAGENPAQGVAMVARAGKLFGLHLNDAHIKLGAEDGLPFGSVNELMALEVALQLQKAGYSGHVYFDTFPLQVDPVAEAEWNIRKFQQLWDRAARLAPRLAVLSERQDAMGVLQLLHQGEGDEEGVGASGQAGIV